MSNDTENGHNVETSIGLIKVSADMIVDLDMLDTDNIDMARHQSYNPHNERFCIIGNEFGALAIVFTTEQDALDSAVDGDKLDCMLMDDETYKEHVDNNWNISYLGDAGEPFNLDYTWLVEYVPDSWLVNLIVNQET